MSESIVGRWAREKLERLGKYLSAYTTIMKGEGAWCQGFHYIDAFAGPGFHLLRDEDTGGIASAYVPMFDEAEFDPLPVERQALLAGSPRVALELNHPFTNYVFVERSPTRIATLE